MSRNVAVVTGANKGIGLAIVRALCKQYKGDVILTARDESRGKDAVSQLGQEGLNPKFHRFDLLDHSSIETLKAFLVKEYGGLDVLVNNAAIAYKATSTVEFGEQVEVTMKTNFLATLDVCETLYPILRPHARVVNISSKAAPITLSKCSAANRQRLTAPDITIDKLKSILLEFQEDAKADKLENWHAWGYGMSKIGVTVMSIIHQKEFDEDAREDLIVNSCSPGYVDTDMTSHKGNLTPDEGAVTPVYLALLPPGVEEPKGKYVGDKKVQPWQA